MKAGKLAKHLAAIALRKMGPYLSNTVELALMVKAQVSQPRVHWVGELVLPIDIYSIE